MLLFILCYLGHIEVWVNLKLKADLIRENNITDVFHSLRCATNLIPRVIKFNIFLNTLYLENSKNSKLRFTDYKKFRDIRFDDLGSHSLKFA